MSEETPKRLSYDPKDAPNPINGYEWYVRAVLIELRLIRMALQELNVPSVVPPPPVVEEKKPATRK